MDEEIELAINRALFLQQALAHIKIMKTRRNVEDTIMAFTNYYPTAEMTVLYCDIIITAMRTEDEGVVDVEQN
jgi:hypothetical protein